MAGLNHVEPGGPACTLPLSPSVTMSKLSVGGMDNNAYLLEAAAALLIDAADEPDRILELIGDRPSRRSSRPTGTATTGRRCRRSSTATRAAPGLRPPRPGRDRHRSLGGEPRPGSGTATPSPSARRRLEVIGLVGHTPGSIALGLRRRPTG